MLRRAVPIFRMLSDGAMDDLLAICRRRTFQRYSWLIREGALGDGITLLLHGQAMLHSNDGDAGKVALDEYGQPLGELVGPEYGAFGMAALVTQMPRREALQAISDCDVLLVPRDALWGLQRVVDDFCYTSAWRELLQRVVGRLLLRINFFKSLVTCAAHDPHRLILYAASVDPVQRALSAQVAPPVARRADGGEGGGRGHAALPRGRRVDVLLHPHRRHDRDLDLQQPGLPLGTPPPRSGRGLASSGCGSTSRGGAARSRRACPACCSSTGPTSMAFLHLVPNMRKRLKADATKILAEEAPPAGEGQHGGKGGGDGDEKVTAGGALLGSARRPSQGGDPSDERTVSVDRWERCALRFTLCPRILGRSCTASLRVRSHPLPTSTTRSHPHWTLPAFLPTRRHPALAARQARVEGARAEGEGGEPREQEQQCVVRRARFQVQREEIAFLGNQYKICSSRDNQNRLKRSETIETLYEHVLIHLIATLHIRLSWHRSRTS